MRTYFTSRFHKALFAFTFLLLSACGGGGGGAASSSATPKSFSFTALLGSEDTEVSLGSAASGMEFYRTTDARCNLDNYASCDQGQMDIVNGDPIEDTALTMDTQALYALKDGNKVSRAVLNAKDFPDRIGHQVVAFDDKLWLIGGRENDTLRYKNDVWFSVDGLNWIQATASADFSARSDHQVVAFNSRLWLIGGYDGSYQSDVWSSADGVTWRSETTDAGFSPRSKHQAIVHLGQIWLYGGTDDPSVDAFRDTWRSSNGTSWTDTNQNGPARHSHQMLVFDGDILVIGGTTGTTAQNDVWTMSDGAGQWTEINDNPAFSARYGHRVAELNGTLYLVGGGLTLSTQDDIYSSNDGETWTLVTNDASVDSRANHQLIAFDDALWVVGGGTDSVDSIWVTQDGTTWAEPEQPGSSVTKRYAHQMVSFKNKLWIIGGATDAITSLNDIWSYESATGWVQVTANAAFGARQGHTVTVFDDKLWVIGGLDADREALNDVWSSSNGLDWTLETASTGFLPRTNHAVAVFDNKLWMVGGYNFDNGDQWFSDVRYSSNGVDWIFSDFDVFDAREAHALVAHAGKLFVVAGNSAAGKINDVWSMTSEGTWTEESVSAEFTAREHHQVVSFDNRMWLFGGKTIGSLYPKDTWMSFNQRNWQEATDYMPVAPSSHQVVVYDDKLWLSGGVVGSTTQDLFKFSEDGETWGPIVSGTMNRPAQ